jgi:hypothetical protein
MAQLQADGCPAASQVGTVTTSANARLLDPLPITVPLTVNGSLYNVVPAAGQPARFGIVLRPIGSDPLPLLEKIVQVSDVKLRKSDLGLSTVLANIPNVAHAAGQALSIPIDITAIDISLSGNVGGQGFMRNPTSCGTKTFGFAATSYANPNQTVTGQATYTSVNCASLPFSPVLKAWVGAAGFTQPGKLPPVKTQILQDPGEAGLRTARVIIPVALSANLEALGHTCPTARFRSNASACPPKSIVGSARAISPLLNAPETGPLVLVGGSSSELPRLGLDLRGPLSIQLFGDFFFTPAQGRAGQVFENLPDIPISNFVLSFKRNGLLITNRNLCLPGRPIFPVSFGGWNGATQSSTVTSTVQGC